MFFPIDHLKDLSLWFALFPRTLIAATLALIFPFSSHLSLFRAYMLLSREESDSAGKRSSSDSAGKKFSSNSSIVS